MYIKYFDVRVKYDIIRKLNLIRDLSHCLQHKKKTNLKYV